MQEPHLHRVHVAPQEEECATQAGVFAQTCCFHACGGAGCDGSIHGKALVHPYTYFQKGWIFCPCCCQIPTESADICKDILTEGPPTRETTYGKGKPHALSPSPQRQPLPESLSPLQLATKISSPYHLPQTPPSQKTQPPVSFHAEKSCHVPFSLATLHPCTCPDSVQNYPSF